MRREERGQTLVEYGLLLALIAVVVIVALMFLGPVVADLFNGIGENLPPTSNEGLLRWHPTRSTSSDPT